MATNYVSAKYSEIVDLQTNTNKTTIIGIHTPTGSKPRLKLGGFFNQFRKFRYNGCKIRMFPSASLPVDPLGVSGIAGTTDTMDPRDNFNPIMFHGCHGDDLNVILNSIYKEGRYSTFSGFGDSVDFQELVTHAWDEYYYSALSDPTWKKFGIQSGVRLNGLRPLVHKVALTKQLVPTSQSHVLNGDGKYNGELIETNASVGNKPTSADHSPGVLNSVGVVASGGMDPDDYSIIPEWNINQMFTNGVQQLGWLPTTSWFSITDTFASASGTENLNVYPGDNHLIPPNDNHLCVQTYLPKCFMGVLMLPPSYKCNQFLRMSIEHYFSFKDFTCSLDPYESYFEGNTYYDYVNHGTSKTVKQAIDETLDLPTLEIINGDVVPVTDGVC